MVSEAGSYNCLDRLVGELTSPFRLSTLRYIGVLAWNSIAMIISRNLTLSTRKKILKKGLITGDIVVNIYRSELI